MISPYNIRILLRSAGLAALTVLTLLTAMVPGTAAATVRFHDLYGCFPLDHHLEILEDPDQKWNIHNVTSPPLSGEFKPARSPVPNLGVSYSALRVRFYLENESATNNEWLFL
jgi:hypothetical protein